MYNPIELPSMQEIEEMDKLQQEAIQSIEISGSGESPQSVKCQSCGAFVPIYGKLQRLHPKRIIALRNQIKCAEQYFFNHHEDKAQLLKQEREELAELIREEQSKELLRRLPLYSAKITGYKYVCSSCWDKAEQEKGLISSITLPMIDTIL